ncbi:MAG: hypothetical protein OEV94_06230 [Deltaproteobacteria bacterium]|nr:hypothetical protein [Deltaproteobacteria bacterium]
MNQTSPVNPLAVRRTRMKGVLICLVSLALGGAFGAGVLAQSYWALAVPVALGVLAVVFLTTWTGYTLYSMDRQAATTERTEGEPDHVPKAHLLERWLARALALMLAVAGPTAGGVFVAGVLQQSYWALAVPVGVFLAVGLGLVFRVGWAVAFSQTTLPMKAAADRQREAALTARSLEQRG